MINRIAELYTPFHCLKLLDIREFWNFYRLNSVEFVQNYIQLIRNTVRRFICLCKYQPVRNGIEFPFDNTRPRCNPHVKIIISSNLTNRYYEKKIVSVIRREWFGSVRRFNLRINQARARARLRENLRFIRWRMPTILYRDIHNTPVL